MRCNLLHFLGKKEYFFLLFFSINNPVFSQSQKQDSLQNIINKNIQDTLHAKALLNLGINLERSDLKGSTENYWALLKMKDDASFEKFKVSAAIRLAGNYSAIGVLDSVDYYFAKAEKIIQANPNDQKLVYTLYNGKGIHYNRIGKFEQALASYEKAIKLDHQAIGLDNVGGLYINLSNVYKQMDNQQANFDATYKALDIFDKTQNKTGLAYVYNSLGTAHYHIKIYEESEKYLLRSLEYRKLLEDKRGESMVIGNLASIYMDTKQHLKAQEYFTMAMEKQEELGLKEMVGIQLYNLGKNYSEMEEYEQALIHFQKAQQVLKEAGISTYDAKILADLGKTQHMLSQEKEAYKSLVAASESAVNQKQLGDAITAFKNLKEYYQAQGKFKEALEAQVLEYAYRDSIGIGALQAQLKELESTYALDLKENEISLLKTEQELDRAELAKRKAKQNLTIVIFSFLILIAGILVNKYRIVGRTKRLLEVEKLRNSIARDLHDDLGSTLSSIHILSQMALQKEGTPDKNLFSKINNQTANMMDKLSDIVWSIHPNNDTLEQLLSKMQEFVAEILEPKGITYQFEIGEGAAHIKLDLEKRRNLFLIFKEALNNAAKYAESKHLDIKLKMEGGKLNLLIKDDGKGFDQEHIKKGNGLFNMQQRASMMGGNMVIESFPNMGTTIQLSAPIA
ncbi:MAG: histidine kinase [Mongoliibacter sp.]|uniref:tetratricopeptide repeat-containing sensor histidine kinase n=1 Tax=Mongoliibacter sp. TaxID=2022438 RepID=UPI0012EFDCC7|nr:tetratricopeptide repeat protein [Mongoliibacter sp.]TVP48104.1 MAG: histidine kinase [Mongoliibacter sp.]